MPRRTAVIIVIACLAAPAVLVAPGSARAFDGGDGTGLVDDAFKQLAVRRNGEALLRLQRKDYAGALAGFREAYRLDPDNPEIVNNLAYILQLLGNVDDAERYYRQTIEIDPTRAVAYLNLADLLSRPGETAQRLSEASLLIDRYRELREVSPDIMLRQARIAARLGRFEDAQKRFQEYLAAATPDDATRIELGDFYRDFGRRDQALDWYKAVDDGSDRAQEAAQRIWDLEVERQAKRFGWTRVGGEVPAQARSLATRARMALGAGRAEEAEALLKDALAAAPQFAEAHADLGDVFVALDRSTDAETSYLRAVAHESGNADWLARLGDFYLEHTQPPRAAEAVLVFERALQLRPDWSRLHLRLAYALRAAGDVGAALEHVRAYLATNEHEPDAVAARELETQLSAAMPTLPVEPDRPRSPVEPGPTTPVADAFSRVRAHLARGELDAAMAVLEKWPEADRGSEVLNLEAGILVSAGRLQEAEEVILRSLAKQPDQAELLARYGNVLLDLGRPAEARERFLQAEKLDSPEASYRLARADLELPSSIWPAWVYDITHLHRLDAAVSRLKIFLYSEPNAADAETARRLIGRAKVRLYGAAGALLAVFAILGVAAALVRSRVWGGATLADLIERRPESAPEVQRVLAALRHEVLKHNTMALTGLIDAIERDEDAGDKAAYLLDALFGKGRGDEGTYARLVNYTEQLRRIGRAHAMRLNLRRRDGAISSLVRGFHLLRSCAPSLRSVSRLSPARRRRLLGRLSQAAYWLHEESYAQIGALLDRLRTQRVDDVVLNGLFERIRREPAFRGRKIEPLDLAIRADGAVRVVMPRSAFEDLVGNVVRNALASSINEQLPTVGVGIDVDTQTDPITGLTHVVIAVKDRAAGTIDPRTLRERPIEHGLGLVADLLARHDGSLDVRPEQNGWTKAVVIKLPRAPQGATTGDEKWS